VELGRGKVGATLHVHLEVANDLPGGQVHSCLQRIGHRSPIGRGKPTPLNCQPTAPLVQVLSLESFSAEHGFTVAASAAAALGSSCELLLQPGQSELLLVTWRPLVPGAVRCVLHLLLGHDTRLQVGCVLMLCSHPPCMTEQKGVQSLNWDH
jgi:hypothetical protein